MNTILCLGLMVCASLALTSAYPSPDLAPDDPVLLIEDGPEVSSAADDETLQPEESRHGRHGWGHGGGGWGHGGGGWGHGGGGWGHGGGGHGYGHGGWGRGGGWGGGYGGGYGYGGGWGGGWYGR